VSRGQAEAPLQQQPLAVGNELAGDGDAGYAPSISTTVLVTLAVNQGPSRAASPMVTL
jgi:hypothetical protein